MKNVLVQLPTDKQYVYENDFKKCFKNRKEKEKKDYRMRQRKNNY